MAGFRERSCSDRSSNLSIISPAILRKTGGSTKVCIFPHIAVRSLLYTDGNTERIL